MEYFVYLTTNLITGKKYIGSHKGKTNDNYLGSGKLIVKSVLKHGKENFKREILEKTENRKKAFALEEKWIKKFKTIKPAGYNISPTGGMGDWGGEHSDETRKHLSEKRKGKEPWNKGKTGIYSAIALDKMRAVDRSGKNNPMYGKKGKKSPIYGIKKTDEHRKKMSDSKMGKNNPNSKKYKIETPDRKKIIINSAADFERDFPEYGKSRNFIYRIEKGQKTTGWKVRKI